MCFNLSAQYKTNSNRGSPLGTTIAGVIAVAHTLSTYAYTGLYMATRMCLIKYPF